MKIPFIGGSYLGRSVAVDSQECVNLFPQLEAPDSKNVSVLYGTPGTTVFSALIGSAGVRCLYETSTGELFAVCGNKLNKIDANGNSFEAGTINTASGVVNMADNGTHIVIVDGLDGYVYSLQNWTDTNSTLHTIGSLETITSDGFVAGTSIVFKDGFFVMNGTISGQFFISEEDDGFNWDALDFATAEGAPDALKAILITGDQLILWGSKSTEFWYTVDDADFPFAPVKHAFIDIGTDAPQSCVTSGNDSFWLGSNNSGHGIVWHTSGYTPQRISTSAIEYAIASMSRTDDAIGYCYQQEGHFFYVLSFPTGNKTLVYDMSTGLWHERSYWNQDAGEPERHRGICHCFHNGKNLIGDYSLPYVYELSLSVYTDNGNTIRRVRTCPHIHSELKRITYSEFELDLERGVGLDVLGPGVDSATPNGLIGHNPQLMLTYSNDGGKTWSSEKWCSAGKVGMNKWRAVWRRLGQARDRVFRVVISEPVKVVFIAAQINGEVEAD